MRRIPNALGSVLEELELSQPLLVTRKTIDSLCAEAAEHPDPRYVLNRLLEEKWLLPLQTRGVWEFSPAARAGPYGSGDPFIELRATLVKRPDLKTAVAAESAAWLHGLSGRVPARHAVGAPKALQLPPALNGFRVVRRWPMLPVELKDGLPVWSVTSLLAAMAIRPGGYRDWPNARSWLSQAFDEVDAEGLPIELEDQPRSAWARLAYLAKVAGEIDASERLLDIAPPGKGPYHLGRRDVPGKYDHRTEVFDSQLITTKL